MLTLKKNEVTASGTKYSRVDQVKFVEDSLSKIRSDMVCLSRPYHLKIFKGSLPQILLSPFLNTLTQVFQSFIERWGENKTDTPKWYAVENRAFLTTKIR